MTTNSIGKFILNRSNTIIKQGPLSKGSSLMPRLADVLQEKTPYRLSSSTLIKFPIQLFIPQQTSSEKKPTILSRNMSEWIHNERFVNGIRPRPNNPLATFTSVTEKYRPDSPEADFQVPTFKLSDKKCSIYIAQECDKRILNQFLKENQVTFPVHPQVNEDLTVFNMPEIIKDSSCKGELTVIPTASSRTVLVADKDLTEVPPFCVKLHYPFQITRSIRHLEKRKIEHSIRISNDFAQVKIHQKNPNFAYLPESFGAAYGNDKKSWGFLVREMTPKPLLAEQGQLLPLFSLYCPDKKNPNKKPMLCTLIEKSNLTPEDFVMEKIFKPLLKCWADVLVETGVVLEAHGQNTCIELDQNGMPNRMVFRDFDTYVNKELREKSGLSFEGLNPYEVFSDRKSVV